MEPFFFSFFFYPFRSSIDLLNIDWCMHQSETRLILLSVSPRQTRSDFMLLTTTNFFVLSLSTSSIQLILLLIFFIHFIEGEKNFLPSLIVHSFSSSILIIRSHPSNTTTYTKRCWTICTHTHIYAYVYVCIYKLHYSLSMKKKHNERETFLLFLFAFDHRLANATRDKTYIHTFFFAFLPSIDAFFVSLIRHSSLHNVKFFEWSIHRLICRFYNSIFSYFSFFEFIRLNKKIISISIETTIQLSVRYFIVMQ